MSREKKEKKGSRFWVLGARGEKFPRPKGRKYLLKNLFPEPRTWNPLLSFLAPRTQHLEPIVSA